MKKTDPLPRRADDKPPTNYQEYLARCAKNQVITGRGLGNVFTHAPCPFCGAPEFMVFEVMETELAMVKEHTCAECERSAKFMVFDIAGGKTFHLVQTGGPDQPDWMVHKMERI